MYGKMHLNNENNSFILKLIINNKNYLNQMNLFYLFFYNI